MQVDLDLGASGAVVLKDKYIITGGKQGPIYIADANNLGGYQPTQNNANVFQVPATLDPFSSGQTRQFQKTSAMASAAELGCILSCANLQLSSVRRLSFYFNAVQKGMLSSSSSG